MQRHSRFFTAWIRIVTGRPRSVIAGSLLITAALLAQLPQLRFDTSFESFVSPSDPTRVVFDRFRDQFGRSEPIVIVARVPEGLRDGDFLAKLRALHLDLEANVPNIRRITSLLNVRSVETRPGELHVGELLKEWPETPQELAALEAKVLASPLYPNYLVPAAEPGEEIAWTALILEPERFAADEAEDPLALDFGDETAVAPPARRLTNEDDLATVAAVRTVLAEHRAANFELIAGGGVVVGEVVSRSMKSDFGRLLGIATGLIGLLLFAFFRHVVSAVLVLAVVTLSLWGTMGAMALVGAPVGFGTQILPTFLLAVGVGYAVHVLTLFWHYFRRLGERCAAVAAALDHAARPLVLTGLTTVGGLMSFAPAELAPISQIGVFAPLGVAIALGYCLALLPALLVVLPLQPMGRREHATGAERAMVRAGLWAVDHPRLVLGSLTGVITFSILGVSRLEVRHDAVAWLPEGSEIRHAVDLIDREFGGANVLELLVETKEGVDLRSPELLQRIDELEAKLLGLVSEHVRVGKVASVHGVVKELNQAFHDGRPEAYRVPDDRGVVAQELLLFENSGMDDVEQLVDTRFETGRISVRVNWTDSFYSVPFAERVVALARAKLDGLATVTPTGLYMLSTKTFVGVIGSMLTSYAIAIAVVGLLILLMVGDVRIGLVCSIPNLIPIAAALGFMGFAGIPIGVFTLLVGSIALGLAVDDTIHLAHSFVRNERACGEPREALRRTLSTVGVAVLFTTAALVSGFLIFGLAELSNMLHFGIVAAFAIAMALVADAFVSPVLFTWVANLRRAQAERATRLRLQPGAGTL